MERATYPEEWARTLERDHDEYMDRLLDGDSDTDATGQPFCGCDTCERRASWSFLIKRILEGHRDGVITLSHD